jgi:uncharacterized protein YndB with AHSA1/START domain
VANQRIETVAHSNAPPERVWSVLDDAGRWHEWGPWSKSGLEREGTPAPGGVGAVRTLKLPGTTLHEEITAYEPPSRMAYELRSGLPVRDYRAEVTLTAAPGGGTEIGWRAEFDGKLPGAGGAMRLMLGRAIPDIAERVAREAERRRPAA